ncbi:cytochrome P450 [Sporichthya sp.]|uniref:cytochrome P450 n=1 Tax=Sporichthya sp. TaxID=65475 RepID=UPI00178DFC6C|nr:cytochrome P450 [Sporichthya sp.]MBA3741977.1 cytochrome P450 [Sporichthya sp.]
MTSADPFKGTAFEGFRHVTDYREIENALKARAAAPRRRPKADHIEEGTLLKIHGDRHTHRRRLEGALFRPEVLEGYSRDVLAVTIDRVVDGLAAEKGPDGSVRVDLVSLGQRIVMEVTAQIIGLDDFEGKGAEIYGLLEDFTEGIKVEYSTGDQTEVIARAQAAKRRYWEDYVKPARDRRAALLRNVDGAGAGATLPHDLISLIVQDQDEQWDDDLLLRECILYVVGAGATTVALVAHTAVDFCRWLEKHPERAEKLDDELLENAIAEALRLHPPFIALVRDCLTSLEGAEFSFEAGETLFLDVGKANLDEGLFGACPREFDPDREVQSQVPRYGLSFGQGRHFCIGRPMALGGRGTGTSGSLFSILRKLLDSGMRLDPEQEPVLASSLESRYAHVPVIFGRL